MKTSVVAGRAAVVFCIAIVAVAGEPWEDKQYSSWSLQDVGKVFGDSPWAKTVQFANPRRSAPEPYGKAIPPGGNPNELETVYTPQGTVIVPRAEPYPSGLPDAERMALAVRWLSSRTVREAVARQWQLTDPAQEARANQLVSAPLEYYTIGIRSGPLPLDLQKVLETAFLQLSPGHKKVLPALVEAVKSSALIAPAAHLLVHFPKEENGQALITSDVSAAEFRCSFDDSGRHIKVKFELREMVRDGRPDL